MAVIRRRLLLIMVQLLSVVTILTLLPIGGNAFVTQQNQQVQLSYRQLQSQTSSPQCAFQWTLCSKRRSDEESRPSTTESRSTTTPGNNPFYVALATGKEQIPNRGNFFYNDEVVSHLYGYVYLIGLFAAQDALFLGTFFILSGLAAYATEQSFLPANPRVPAITALLTLGITILSRYVFAYEPPMNGILDGYEGPTDSALLFEVGICVLISIWGFFGTWRTKEPSEDGATYGFWIIECGVTSGRK